MYDPSRHITRITIGILEDAVIVVTTYRPDTLVGLALTEEVITREALEKSLSVDAQLEILRDFVDHE